MFAKRSTIFKKNKKLQQNQTNDQEVKKLSPSKDVDINIKNCTTKDYDSHLNEFHVNKRKYTDDSSLENLDDVDEKYSKEVCIDNKINRPTFFHKKSKFIMSSKKTNDPSKSLDEDDEIYRSSRRFERCVTDYNATATLSVDTEKDKDHRAILERNIKIGKEILEGKLSENLYRGKGAYKPIMNSNREELLSSNKYLGRYGPIRGSDHVRLTLRVDYAPDICKDYKETGYCGWGDTCKFLHDRSDYKSGWQLENEWNQMQEKKKQKKIAMLKRKQEKLLGKANKNEDDSGSNEVSDNDSDRSDNSSSTSDDDSAQNLPFACLICKKNWREVLDNNINPVVTLCNHYFCENCAYKHYGKSSKCFKCHRPTDGIFNTASKILNKVNEAPHDKETSD